MRTQTWFALKGIAVILALVGFGFGIVMANEAPPGFDVTQRIADHDAVAGASGGEVAEGLLEQPGQRLAAIALPLIVGTDVNGVQMSSTFCQLRMQLNMYLLQILR